VVRLKFSLSVLVIGLFLASGHLFSIHAYGYGPYGGCVYGYDCPDTVSAIGDSEDITITVTSTSSNTGPGSTDDTEDMTYYTVKIVDEAGNPISGARVVISELGIDIATDSNGIADLGELPTGSYDIQVTYGDKTYAKVLSVTDNAGSQILVTIQSESPAPNLLPYVLVGGVILVGIAIWLWKRQPSQRLDESMR
jgi:hypothetical protein